MKDQVSVSRIQLLHPKVREQFTNFMNAIEAQTGLTFRIVQGLRTFAQQDAIYQEGRTTPGVNIRPGHPLGDPVSFAKAGQSFHNYGLACDIESFMIGSTAELNWNYNLQNIRQIAIDNGLECGMDWPEPKTDRDHFQNSFGYDWQELLDKYNAHEFILGTQFLDI